MQNQTLDLVAKLLANENIHVVRAPVTTASFNIESRTLMLPQWREMTPEIDEMLVAHEVSHALFTTEEYHIALDTTLRFKRAKSFLNILEDARIEKLMKRRYPGLRKTFNIGYKGLNEMDFFGIRNRDLSDAHLMDKINLYFKVGYGVVDFTPAEKPFVVRTENLETIEETITLARDIHEFLKEQEAKALAQQAAAQAADPEEEPEEDEDNDGEEQDIPEIDDEDTDHSFDQLMDEAPDDSEDSEDGQQDEANTTGSDDKEGQSEQAGDESDTEQTTDGESESDGEPDTEGATVAAKPTKSETTDPKEYDMEGDEPTTNSSFEDRVGELADTSTVYKYFTIKDCQFNPIISYKEVMTEIDNRYENPISDSGRTMIQEFKRDTQNNVDYLVKEFEMRKAATSYKRAQVSKSGSLDMSKVWSYKLNDDLFKRVTTVKQGKNHGMVFLLDWSGSMHNVMKDTIDQVINLAMFCSRAGIAYQVFAFTDAALSKDGERHRNIPFDIRRQVSDDVIDVSNSSFALLELFTNKMSTSEFNKMVGNLKTRRVEMTYQLNGTPLNEALTYCYQYIETFQKMNNVEKVSFITLTDGQGGGLPAYFTRTDYDNSNGMMKRRNVRNYIKDTFTKKNIEVTTDSATQTSALIEMIKNRYNCTVLGFFITKNSRRDLFGVLRAHYGDLKNDTFDVVERMKSEFRTNGYASLKGTGRDELFVVPTTSTKVQYEELQVDSDSNARAIAAKFGKYMSTKKTSRILLNKFIGYVA